MSRKDNKGRVLKTGESQRKDGSYMYRWTEPLAKKRQTVYAKTLNELREKENQIIKEEIIYGNTYSQGRITVNELLKEYMDQQKRMVKKTTFSKYKYLYNIIKKSFVSEMKIRDVKTSTAKKLCKYWQDECEYNFGTIQNLKTFLGPAFQFAVEDDILAKNPFRFSLSKVIQDDRTSRFAISEDEAMKFYDYMSSHGWFRHSCPDFIILLDTGMRVSELYGLTRKDIDMKNRTIDINKQLHRINGEYIIQTPKTKAGKRKLYMSSRVYESFKQVIAEKKVNTEYIIDGYSGFLFYNHMGLPKTRRNLERTMFNVRKKYKEDGLGEFKKITPHTLRHTFCTRMVEKGMDITSLQLLMGHDDISTTMNIYAHKDQKYAVDDMKKFVI